MRSARARRAGGGGRGRGLRAWQAVLEDEGPLDPKDLPPDAALVGPAAAVRGISATGGALDMGRGVGDRGESYYDDIRAKLGLPTHREQLAEAQEALKSSALQLGGGREGRDRDGGDIRNPRAGLRAPLVTPKAQDALNRSFEGGAASVRRRYPELFKDLPPSAHGEVAAALNGSAASEASREALKRLSRPLTSPLPGAIGPTGSPRPKTSRGRSCGGGHGEAPQVFSP